MWARVCPARETPRLRGCYNFRGYFRRHSSTWGVPFTRAPAASAAGAHLSLFYRGETSVSRLYPTRGKETALPFDHRRPLASHSERTGRAISVREKRSNGRAQLLFSFFAGTFLTAIASRATISRLFTQFEVVDGEHDEDVLL